MRSGDRLGPGRQERERHTVLLSLSPRCREAHMLAHWQQKRRAASSEGPRFPARPGQGRRRHYLARACRACAPPARCTAGAGEEPCSLYSCGVNGHRTALIWRPGEAGVEGESTRSAGRRLSSGARVAGPRPAAPLSILIGSA